MQSEDSETVTVVKRTATILVMIVVAMITLSCGASQSEIRFAKRSKLIKAGYVDTIITKTQILDSNGRDLYQGFIAIHNSDTIIVKREQVTIAYNQTMVVLLPAE